MSNDFALGSARRDNHRSKAEVDMANYGLRFSALNYGTNKAIHNYPLYAVANRLQGEKKGLQDAFACLAA